MLTGIIIYTPGHRTEAGIEAGPNPGRPVSIVDTVTALLRKMSFMTVRHARGNTAKAGAGESFILSLHAFSILTLLVMKQEEQSACEKLSDELLA